MLETQYAAQITIPEGEVAKITDANGNIIWQKCDYINIPYNSEKSDALPVQSITVAAGDNIVIYYYLTSSSGVFYDASNYGGSKVSSNEVNQSTHSAVSFTASKAGKLIIGGTYQYYNWGMDWPGSLGMSPPYGKYIKVKIN